MSILQAGVIYARMTKQQRELLDKVRVARSELDDYQRREEVLISAVHVAIYDAVKAGVPVRQVSDAAAFSVSRIYRIRDEVAVHRE